MTSAHWPHLRDKHLALVFAYSPAGLGHLRVTNALRHGLPSDLDPLLIVHNDEVIRSLHRLTSTNPLGKKLFEWAQSGRPEDILTRLYRKILRGRNRRLEKQLRFILNQRLDQPKTILVIATHFGLAHQIASIKKRFEQKNGVRLVLIVQVTDDSPQHIWYVPGADLTLVPSQETALALHQYGREEQLESIKIEVAAYPISPTLGAELEKNEHNYRTKQLSSHGMGPLHISLPISGAAVGLMFTDLFMQKLSRKIRGALFHVVVKKTAYTQIFISRISRRPYAQVLTSHSDRQIVELYEQSIADATIALEVTKPSEQAFKALFDPKQKGGFILLFTDPVGRQEYDNLAFLERHELLPTKQENALLWSWAKEDLSLKSSSATRILQRAKLWRSLRLPTSPTEAAEFIAWCKSSGLFSAMLDWHPPRKKEKELSSEGVQQFWVAVEKLLS